jgi:hypothetical protein
MEWDPRESRNSKKSNWEVDATTQVRWGLGYIERTYGPKTWHGRMARWLRLVLRRGYNWYSSGGKIG